MVINRPQSLPVRRALIIVDVQNDFCEGGSLAVEGGGAVAGNITRWVNDHGGKYDAVVATADWHTEHTEGHFAPDGTDPDFADTWPVHCMADADGSDFHPDLQLPDGTDVFYKGQTDASYSGFDGATDDGTTLVNYLRDRGITHVDVVGLAFDFCVKATAVDAQANGCNTRVLKALTGSVSHATEQAALQELSVARVDILRDAAALTADYAVAT